MSHYLLHHVRLDGRFNRECSKHIPSRRLPNSTIICPELVVLFVYRIDDITRQISTAEKDSDIIVRSTGSVSAQVTHLDQIKDIKTIHKKMYFSAKAHLRFLDLEISGGLKGVEAKFSAPHLEALLSINGYVDTTTNKMEVDYRQL